MAVASSVTGGNEQIAEFSTRLALHDQRRQPGGRRARFCGQSAKSERSTNEVRAADVNLATLLDQLDRRRCPGPERSERSSELL